jgi:inward rectifier potassium channel
LTQSPSDKDQPSAADRIKQVVINRDGTLNIKRPHEPGKLFSDLYHQFLSISWPKFFTILFIVFLSTNLFFGWLYFMFGPQALDGIHQTDDAKRFMDCFFFSVQSLSSPFKPVGFWPNMVVTIQIYLGMLTLVLVTGLFYARFARPKARVIFSNNAIINDYNKKRCFFFRVANERLNQIIEARMILTLTKNVTSPEGEVSRKFFNMKLEFDYSPVFALSWTIRHFMDEESPLYGMDIKAMQDAEVVIFASLSGLDDTFSQTITARTVYRYDEILCDKRFKDMLHWKDGLMHIDLKGIHDIQ